MNNLVRFNINSKYISSSLFMFQKNEKKHLRQPNQQAQPAQLNLPEKQKLSNLVQKRNDFVRTFGHHSHVELYL